MFRFLQVVIQRKEMRTEPQLCHLLLATHKPLVFMSSISRISKTWASANFSFYYIALLFMNLPFQNWEWTFCRVYLIFRKKDIKQKKYLDSPDEKEDIFVIRLENDRFQTKHRLCFYSKVLCRSCFGEAAFVSRYQQDLLLYSTSGCFLCRKCVIVLEKHRTSAHMLHLWKHATSTLIAVDCLKQLDFFLC